MGPGIVFGILIITIGLSLFFFLRARHIERMAMIEKGTLQANLEAVRKPFFRAPNFIGIKIGMLLLGIGLGLVIATFISVGINNDAIYPAMIFLCGGSALVASFFVERNLAEKYRRDEEL